MDSTKISDLPNYSEGEPVQYHIQQNQHPSLPMQPTVFPPNPEIVMREYPDDLMPSANLGKTNYMPLNIHPNPYMSSPPAQSHPQQPEPETMQEHAKANAEAQALYDQLYKNHPQHQQSEDNDNELPSSSKPKRPRPRPRSKSTETDIFLDNYVPKQHQRIPLHDISIDPMDYTHDEAILANHIPNLDKIKVNDYIKEYDETEGAKIHEHELEKARKTWYERVFHSIKNPILVFLFFIIFQMQFVKTMMMATLGRFTGKWLFSEDGNFTTLGLIVKTSIFTAAFVLLNWILTVI